MAETSLVKYVSKEPKKGPLTSVCTEGKPKEISVWASLKCGQIGEVN
jgi:hypothetical protein